MRYKVIWTEQSVRHIARQGLERPDVDAALRGPIYVRRGTDRVAALGKCRIGVVFVVLAPSHVVPGSFEVVTARRATRGERRLFWRHRK